MDFKTYGSACYLHNQLVKMRKNTSMIQSNSYQQQPLMTVTLLDASDWTLEIKGPS